MRTEVGWGVEEFEWFWPLIAGHHGRVCGHDGLAVPHARLQGRRGWPAAQRAVVDRVLDELDLDLCEFAGRLRRPSRGIQLALSGLVIMADWVASDDAHFSGLSDLALVSMSGARERAAVAWRALGLRGGWRSSALRPGVPDLVEHRFGVPGRRFQWDAVAVAGRMAAPGLVILEAPMGEGKTEAALAVAEVLAARFGADGLFVGMPTQATSDPMFGRVTRWLAGIDPSVPVALLHGRSRFNKEWAVLQELRFPR